MIDEWDNVINAVCLLMGAHECLCVCRGARQVGVCASWRCHQDGQDGSAGGSGVCLKE